MLYIIYIYSWVLLSKVLQYFLSITILSLDYYSNLTSPRNIMNYTTNIAIFPSTAIFANYNIVSLLLTVISQNILIIYYKTFDNATTSCDISNHCNTFYSFSKWCTHYCTVDSFWTILQYIASIAIIIIPSPGMTTFSSNTACSSILWYRNSYNYIAMMFPFVHE